MTENCKCITDFLNCEYEVFENEKNDARLMKTFNEWSSEGREKGFYPLIIKPDDILAESLELGLEDMELEFTQEEIKKYRDSIIKESEDIDVKEFLDARFSEYSEMHEDIDITGKFLDTKPGSVFYSHMDRGVPHKEILMVKIPVKNPWEIAAWIPMGGFNDCPSPAEQTAVFKYWYEKYKAVPAVVTYDVWEMKTDNPPKNEEEAEILAREQFAFCYDIVMQASSGWDTIRALASTLKNSSSWYFWWD
jgi:hypothetical protein